MAGNFARNFISTTLVAVGMFFIASTYQEGPIVSESGKSKKIYPSYNWIGQQCTSYGGCYRPVWFGLGTGVLFLAYLVFTGKQRVRTPKIFAPFQLTEYAKQKLAESGANAPNSADAAAQQKLSPAALRLIEKLKEGGMREQNYAEQLIDAGVPEKIAQEAEQVIKEELGKAIDPDTIDEILDYLKAFYGKPIA